MKIAYVNDAIITCGGVLTNFEHCKRLIEKGYDAFVVYNTPGYNIKEMRVAYPTVPIKYIEKLGILMDDEDIIIANWWMQVNELEQFNGRKIQFLQGNDIAGNIGDDYKKRCLEVRSRKNWEIMAVSEYAGSWTGREFTIIPNGINDRFFTKLGLERDIDALIEGNDEPNKNIQHSIDLAKADGHKKIVWFGRTTHPIEGVECISSPDQEEIPKLYQRAKHFYKHSLSEGFCLPLAEAIVSGCEIHTGDMGNTFTKDQDFRWQIQKLIKFYEQV